MYYSISYKAPNTHFIDIKLTIDVKNEEEINLQLPSWRPGRYELANFAKNIQKFKVENELGEEIAFNKITTDRWSINTSKSAKINVYYNYYAFQMDAGNSYLDENQLYINFINCLLYDEKRLNHKCFVKLNIPSNYQIACGLQETEKNILESPNYFQLVDSPMIASNQLKKLSYSINNYQFFIWINGIVEIDEDVVLKDFIAFTKSQIELFGGFPSSDYHFLFQILPYKHYHGVEHFNSTIITLGPSEKFNTREFYNNLLGVSSHELFHTWNIIRIRPKEMMPYDFSKENYFTTGFVAEGFTTYYGDLFLVRSGVYNKNIYLKELNALIFKHFENNGRFNKSLAESSIDLWLDGYVTGIPDRKVSIYIKGAVVALMLDLEIRAITNYRKSLDDVMRFLWEHFGMMNKGYTLDDIKVAIEHVSEHNFTTFFKDFILGTHPEEQKLQELLQNVGCLLKAVDIVGFENNFGFKVSTEGSTKITVIEAGSLAESQLSLEDELIAVNNRKIENNFQLLIENRKDIELTLFRNKNLRTIRLVNNGEQYFKNFMIVQNPEASLNEKVHFEKWLGCSW